MNCPIRDILLKKSVILQINRQYEEDYAMAQFEHMMKPTQDAYDNARKKAWAVYVQTMKT
jgi:hypothetical protein